jgi:hypothetical protein
MCKIPRLSIVVLLNERVYEHMAFYHPYLMREYSASIEYNALREIPTFLSVLSNAVMEYPDEVK